MKQVGKYQLRDLSIFDQDALEVLEGCHLHNTEEPFKDGDCILIEYGESDFDDVEDVENVLQSAYSESDFELTVYGVNNDQLYARINPMSAQTYGALVREYADTYVCGLSSDEITSLYWPEVFGDIFTDPFTGKRFQEAHANIARWLDPEDWRQFAIDVVAEARKECGLDD